MINLQDKLYTSTEVADILGVSLRSVYRYIEENKLVPEVKTATGRHRFTKQNIVDFLYPNGSDQKINLSDTEDSSSEQPIKSSVKLVKKSSSSTASPQEQPVKEAAKIPEVVEEDKEETKEEKINEPVKEEVKEEPVDWLAKFREAAKKFEEESSPKEDKPLKEAKEAKVEAPSIKEKFAGLAPEEEKSTSNMLYYRSRLGGLKDIAQNIEKASKNSGLDYAFTMNAGLSLHSPIKPFSILHVYVRSKDRDFFERILMLTPSDEENAQLCMIPSDDNKIYNTSTVVHGLTVVSKDKLLNDIREIDTEGSLAKEAESILG